MNEKQTCPYMREVSAIRCVYNKKVDSIVEALVVTPVSKTLVLNCGHEVSVTQVYNTLPKEEYFCKECADSSPSRFLTIEEKTEILKSCEEINILQLS
jgi:hypothetical protein